MSERTFLRYGIQALLPLVFAALLPHMAFAEAEPLLLAHDAAHLRQPSVQALPVKRSSVTLGLDDNGDLALRGSDLMLTLAYTPDPNEPQKIKYCPKQEPSISGISVKLSFLF